MKQPNSQFTQNTNAGHQVISIEGLDDHKPGGDKKFGSQDDQRPSMLSTGRESGSYTSRSSSNQMHALPI